MYQAFFYGSYAIVLRIPQLDGRQLVLGFKQDCRDQWCTGIEGGGSGSYFETREAAYADLAARMAEAAGLVLAAEGSVVIGPENVRKLKRAALDLYAANQDSRTKPTSDEADVIALTVELEEKVDRVNDLLGDLNLMGDPSDFPEEPELKNKPIPSYTASSLTDAIYGGENFNRGDN